MRKYENLTLLHENTLPPRAHYIPYDSLQKALLGDKSQSNEYILLNGEWDFKYFNRDIDCLAIEILSAMRRNAPCQRGEGHEVAREFTWDTITVPSCWQNEGIEPPYYTNINYQFPVDPPYVPDDNPVGVYRRFIEFTTEQTDKENYIVFEGVSSCFEVFLNGVYIGYSSVSHCTSEFKLPLEEGTNELIVKVYKWNAGTYLEDQDFFRCNGIFRDVYLLLRSQGHLHDINIGFDDKGIYCNEPHQIFDADGNLTDLSSPILWNAEHPYLYTVIVESAGEFIPFKIGLRTQAISDKGELLINGVSVKLKGVNHHDTHPQNGYTVTRAFLYEELLKMKELNINAIRTSHYPPTPDFIELCDELGFYIIDEADLESHGFVNREMGYRYDDNDIWPCKNSEWKQAFLDRVERLYERDKNHTCVIMWSLGNESNYGENHKAMSDFVRSREASREGITRLIHYEGAGSGKYETIDPSAVDVVSRMYATPEEALEYYKNTGDKRPFVWCEYCHAMGNGPGDLYDYWEYINRLPHFIGGFIWEWTDHVAANDKGKLCYGGDFGEETDDGSFCCDGLTFNDRSFKAGTLEAKYVYQPLDAIYKDGQLTLTNKFDFTSFEGFTFEWSVTADGFEAQGGTIELSTAPHCSESVKLDIEAPESKYGSYFNLSMKDSHGNELAFYQCEIQKPFPLGKASAKLTKEATPHVKGERATFKGSHKAGFVGKRSTRRSSVLGLRLADPLATESSCDETRGFTNTFNLHYGYLESINNLLSTPMILSIWRAPIDNDEPVLKAWHDARYDKVHNKVYSTEVKDNQIIVNGVLGGISRIPFFKYTATYSFFEDGGINVNLSGKFNAKMGFLPRLGFEFKTKEESFKYFGYGPQESYIDMHHGSRVNMYHSNADAEYVNYIKPQEHGNHYGVKYMHIGGYDIECPQGMEINVSHYDEAELSSKKHNFELVKSNLTRVRLDYKVSGLGSAICGPALAEKYQLKEENIEFEFTITPAK